MEPKELHHTIAEAKKNNQKAFAILFDTHWDYVFGYLLKQTSNEGLAEELALKTFAKAFDKISLFKEELNFKTWLISISKNVNIDHHRREKTVAQLDTTSIEKENFNTIYDENPSPEDLLIINQNLKRLIAIIKELKPLYARVIRMRYFEEHSYKEIAEKTQLPINTVKVTILRAKKLLAQKIEEQAWNGRKN